MLCWVKLRRKTFTSSQVRELGGVEFRCIAIRKVGPASHSRSRTFLFFSLRKIRVLLIVKVALLRRGDTGRRGEREREGLLRASRSVRWRRVCLRLSGRIFLFFLSFLFFFWSLQRTDQTKNCSGCVSPSAGDQKRGPAAHRRAGRVSSE